MICAASKSTRSQEAQRARARRPRWSRLACARERKCKAIRASIAGLEKPSQYAITFAPIFIAYSAALINPEQFSGLIETDSQRVLPTRLLEHTPDVAQAIFFAAALSAIMSCSSATLRAPSVAFLENTVRNFSPRLATTPFCA